MNLRRPSTPPSATRISDIQGKALLSKAKAFGFEPPFTDEQLDTLAPYLQPMVRQAIEADAKKTGFPVDHLRRVCMRYLIDPTGKEKR